MPRRGLRFRESVAADRVTARRAAAGVTAPPGSRPVRPRSCQMFTFWCTFGGN